MRATWPVRLTQADELILGLCKKQPLWGFFRRYRHVLFDDDTVGALDALYRPDGRGRLPIDVRQKGMAMLLQVAFDVPDHEVPTLTVVDARWQMVLGCHGREEPLLQQGTVFDFRVRAMEAGVVSLLLEKTVEIARKTAGFDHKRLRAIFDSSPLLGAGRVEDTMNLIGGAILDLARVAAEEADRPLGDVVEEAGLDLARSSSVKAWLDIDWQSPTARSEAITRLLQQFDHLRGWLQTQLPAEQLGKPPLGHHLELVERLIEQDTEPEPPPAAAEAPPEEPPAPATPGEPAATPAAAPEAGRRRIRQGVAHDRIISRSDLDMRHGRKSRTKTFNGYKRHVGQDADIEGLIVVTELVPANAREHEPVDRLLGLLALRGFEVVEVHADRGYLPAEGLHDRRRRGLRLVTKPPAESHGEHFPKSKFRVDFRSGTLTCPAGHEALAEPVTRFPKRTCGACPLRPQCTDCANGRSVTLHPEEQFHRELAARIATPQGRRDARERVAIEHVLARVGQIQGRRARFRTLEKNRFDLERAAVVNNCFVLDRLLRRAA